MTETKDEDYYVSEFVHFNGEMDPKVKIELDTLNQTAMCINRLEKELDESTAHYQRTFAEFSRQLEQLKNNIGSSIKRARPFYELKEVARKKQAEAMRSAQQFQTANSVYLAEKESVLLAELRLQDDRTVCLSDEWQSTFNQARLMDAEKEKFASEEEHLKCAVSFIDVENKMHALEKKYKRSIVKARSYFEIKKKLEVKLQQVKQSVEDIQQAIQEAKQQYSGALKCLEKISVSIHKKRCQNIILMFPCEPEGVVDGHCTEREREFPTPSTPEDPHSLDGLYDDGGNDSNENNIDDDH